MVMYEAQVNSPPTYLGSGIDEVQTVITVLDSSLLPNTPTILTIGYELLTAETVLVNSVNGNDLTVQRGFEGDARIWDSGTPIARMHTAYDHNTMKTIIEGLESGGGTFTTTDKFIDTDYVYLVGNVSSGWKVNRYSITNDKTISSGITNIPTTLLECQELVYV